MVSDPSFGSPAPRSCYSYSHIESFRTTHLSKIHACSVISFNSHMSKPNGISYGVRSEDEGSDMDVSSDDEGLSICQPLPNHFQEQLQVGVLFYSLIIRLTVVRCWTDSAWNHRTRPTAECFSRPIATLFGNISYRI